MSTFSGFPSSDFLSPRSIDRQTNSFIRQNGGSFASATTNAGSLFNDPFGENPDPKTILNTTNNSIDQIMATNFVGRLGSPVFLDNFDNDLNPLQWHNPTANDILLGTLFSYSSILNGGFSFPNNANPFPANTGSLGGSFGVPSNFIPVPVAFPVGIPVSGSNGASTSGTSTSGNGASDGQQMLPAFAMAPVFVQNNFFNGPIQTNVNTQNISPFNAFNSASVPQWGSGRASQPYGPGMQLMESMMRMISILTSQSGAISADYLA